MVTQWCLIVVICVFIQTCWFQQTNNEYKRVCYFTNWSQGRPAPYNFFPENIDTDLCTHVIYAFGKVVRNDVQPYKTSDRGSRGMYQRVLALKRQKPDLKLLIAIGGWNHGTAPFSAVVASDSNMRAFAQNALRYIRGIQYDGLDLDWEYPGTNGSPAVDKQRFTSLVIILRRKFEDEARTTGRDRLLLTAAVAAGKWRIDAGYEIDQIARNLDFINLMAYDLHGSWEQFTGHNSPLYARQGEYGGQENLIQDFAVRYWIDNGTPPNKLIMGLPFYGRSFTLRSSAQNTLGSPASGPGTAGQYSREAGTLAYYEICAKLSSGWTRVWNEQQKVPYAYSRNQWVGYEDVQSIGLKTNYIKRMGLGGAMIWSLDFDDFSNQCGQGRYPLLNKINEGLGSRGPVSPTRRPTQFPTMAPTTQAPTMAPTTQALTQAPGFSCYGKATGHYKDYQDCNKFYQCWNGRKYHQSCPAGTYFNLPGYCGRPCNM